MKIFIELEDKRELAEIYNALCALNVSIRAKQKKRAKYIQKLIREFTPFSVTSNGEDKK